ncbi:mercuric reductase, partial [Mycoplasmopsis pullorum]
MNKYDLVVIGWGKGGKTLAKEVANAGLKVAIIEKDPKMYGGTCINVGCLPSKSLVHSAKVLQQVQKLGVERNWEFNQKTFKE